MAELSRKEIVLKRFGVVAYAETLATNREFIQVNFVSEIEEVPKEDQNPDVIELSMDDPTWTEFGKPDEITVTIVAGDRLNNG